MPLLARPTGEILTTPCHLSGTVDKRAQDCPVDRIGKRRSGSQALSCRGRVIHVTGPDLRHPGILVPDRNLETSDTVVHRAYIGVGPIGVGEGTDMARIADVAAYILHSRGPMTAMKLQKLCYYANGYHMAWEGRVLFDEPFEAWANGPVAPALYRQHRGRFTLKDGDILGDCNALDEGERESIDIVLSNLGGLSAHELSQMTHRESPWLRARERSGAGPMDRSTEELDVGDIGEHFEALVASVDA